MEVWLQAPDLRGDDCIETLAGISGLLSGSWLSTPYL